MARPKGEIKVVCPNPRCRYYLEEEGKDIIKKGKYPSGHQRYYCKHCKTYFMETNETPLYWKHLSKEEIIRICKLLVEKNGIRSIERITGHHRDTISRLLEDLAEHAEAVNDILLKEVKLSPIEVDELWSAVKKNKRELSARAKEQMRRAMRGSTQP